VMQTRRAGAMFMPIISPPPAYLLCNIPNVVTTPPYRAVSTRNRVGFGWWSGWRCLLCEEAYRRRFCSGVISSSSGVMDAHLARRARRGCGSSSSSSSSSSADRPRLIELCSNSLKAVLLSCCHLVCDSVASAKVQYLSKVACSSRCTNFVHLVAGGRG